MGECTLNIYLPFTWFTLCFCHELSYHPVYDYCSCSYLNALAIHGFDKIRILILKWWKLITLQMFLPMWLTKPIMWNEDVCNSVAYGFISKLPGTAQNIMRNRRKEKIRKRKTSWWRWTVSKTKWFLVSTSLYYFLRF